MSPLRQLNPFPSQSTRLGKPERTQHFLEKKAISAHIRTVKDIAELAAVRYLPDVLLLTYFIALWLDYTCDLLTSRIYALLFDHVRHVIALQLPRHGVLIMAINSRLKHQQWMRSLPTLSTPPMF